MNTMMCTAAGCHAAGHPQPLTEFRRSGRHTCRTCVNARAAERARERASSLYAVDRERGGLLPIEPFRGWLRARMREMRFQHDEPYFAMCNRLDVADKTLSRWLNQESVRFVLLDSVDKAFCQWGDAGLLRELYPDVYAGSRPPDLTHVQAA